MKGPVVLYGGVEGGGTHSTTILLNQEGEEVAMVEGPSTNIYQIGLEETCSRIRSMVTECLVVGGYPESTVLEGLGLSLSGCEREETNTSLVAMMVNNYPGLARHYEVCSDTVGTLYTASDDGGVVLIAGTGSNALLVNPDKSVFRCGGWGHYLGDEGGAWWIAHRACKVYFDHLDNMENAVADINTLQQVIFTHFNIRDRFGILEHCYDKFSKAYFASLTVKISEAAFAGDDLCRWLFREAGKKLGRHIRALDNNISKDLREAEGGLNILCVGSVWKSWELLKTGFMEGLKDMTGKPCLAEFTMVKLSVSMATGAAYLGAKAAGTLIPRNQENVEKFFSFKH